MITQFHLDVVKCHTVFQPCHFRLYQEIPLYVVNEASPTLAEFASVPQESFTVGDCLAKVAADLWKSLQIPFVIVRRERRNLPSDISNHLAQLFQVPGQILNVDPEVGILFF